MNVYFLECVALWKQITRNFLSWSEPLKGHVWRSRSCDTNKFHFCFHKKNQSLKEVFRMQQVFSRPRTTSGKKVVSFVEPLEFRIWLREWTVQIQKTLKQDSKDFKQPFSSVADLSKFWLIRIEVWFDQTVHYKSTHFFPPILFVSLLPIEPISVGRCRWSKPRVWNFRYKNFCFTVAVYREASATSNEFISNANKFTQLLISWLIHDPSLWGWRSGARITLDWKKCQITYFPILFFSIFD